MPGRRAHALADTCMVNYFGPPGGFDMWAAYSPSRVGADLAKIAALGFNAVRVVLNSSHGFTFPRPTAVETGRLVDLLGRAAANGMQAYLTLFDYSQNPRAGTGVQGQVADAKTWFTAVWDAITAAGLGEVIWGFDLMNETVFDPQTSPGNTAWRGRFDRGWTGAQPRTVGAVNQAWAVQMVPWLRALTGHRVTCSTNGWAQQSALASALKTAGVPCDFVDYHFYEQWDHMPAKFFTTISVCGGPSSLFIGEAGYETTPTGAQTTAQAEQLGADYLWDLAWECNLRGVARAAPWTAFDMSANAQFPAGQKFGLWRTDGTAKPAAAVMQTLLAGGRPVHSLRPMSAGLRYDRHGNGLPDGWFAWKGNGMTAAMTTSVDTTNTDNGQPTVRLTACSAVGSDTPYLQARIDVTPSVRHTFGMRLRAAGAYGRPRLQIDWFTSGGVYIASVNSPTLRLSSAFADFSITGIAPANAARAQVGVAVPNNAGTIWACAPTWT